MNRNLCVESLEVRQLLTAVDIGECRYGDIVEVQAPVAMTLAEGESEAAIQARQFMGALLVVPLPPDPLGATGAPGAAEGESSVPGQVVGGTAHLSLAKDGSAFEFRVDLLGLAGGAVARLRLATTAGSDVVIGTLFDLDLPDGVPAEVTGNLTQDDLHADESAGFDGTISGLLEAMRSGQVSIAVSTVDGEALEGMLEPVPVRPFHNPLNRLDVTGDAIVSPRDAIAVITDLNANGARIVEGESTATPLSQRLFFDVTGDNIVSSRDVLEIISSLTTLATDAANQRSRTVDDMVRVLKVQPVERFELDWQAAVDDIVMEQGASLESVIDALAGALQEQYVRDYYAKVGVAETLAIVKLNWDVVRDHAELSSSDGGEESLGTSAGGSGPPVPVL